MGLMDRGALPQDHGMLFIYPLESELRFWMRNTLIPLDILFLGSTLRVVDVQRMTPQPGVPPQDLTIYASQAPARYALEVNAGRAEACGVAPGAEASWKASALKDHSGTQRGGFPHHSPRCVRKRVWSVACADWVCRQWCIDPA